MPKYVDPVQRMYEKDETYERLESGHYGPISRILGAYRKYRHKETDRIIYLLEGQQGVEEWWEDQFENEFVEVHL